MHFKNALPSDVDCVLSYLPFILSMGGEIVFFLNVLPSDVDCDVLSSLPFVLSIFPIMESNHS